MSKKMNRIERTQNFNEKRAAALAGTGVFLYKNIGKADMMLPKKTNEGYKMVASGQQFRGDSFFQKLVGQGLALIKDETPKIEPPKVIKNNPAPVVDIKECTNEGKLMEKLILDQPDSVTTQGKVEQVVKNTCLGQCQCQNQKKLNEVQPELGKVDDVLISEDPLAGVEIILKD